MKTYQYVLVALAFPVVLGAYSLYSNIITKPAALVAQATDTNKMIANYEWFHEAATTFEARKVQVNSYKKILAEEEDKAEKQRLRVDLSAVQQSCRELAAKYAAQSGKIHVGYLKSNSLPDTLNAKECE